MDKYFYFYLFISFLAVLIVIGREWIIHKTAVIHRFSVLCSDQSLLTTLLQRSKKKFFFMLIRELGVWLYLIYCIVNLVKALELWRIDIWIGLALLSFLLLSRQLIYVSAKFMVRKADELRIQV